MYFFLDIVGFCLSKLPNRWIYILAQGVTFLGYDLAKVRRNVIHKNLSIVFPKMDASQRVKLGRESFLNFVLTALEFLRGKHVDLAKAVTFEGQEHLRDALAEGKGAFILCMHMGNWEAMGAAINRFICPARVVVKKVGSDAVDRWVTDVRKTNGFLTIKRKRKGDGSRAILQTLRAGEIVGFVMDQYRPGEPRFPFFGKSARTNTSMAAIWRKHSVPVIPSFSFRTNVGEHVVRFLPPLHLEVSGEKNNDIIDATSLFNEKLEEMILQKPEFYFWFHNRWKK